MVFQQNYTREALQIWFTDYHPGWMTTDTSILRAAKAWYEQKKIRRFEINRDYLFLTTREDKRTFYTTVEKNPKGPRKLNVCSSSHLRDGQITATVGLYLLEELFEKNLDWLGMEACSPPEAPSAKAVRSWKPTVRRNPQLELIFRALPEGLCFRVMERDFVAFREDFLRLIRWAHRAGFIRDGNEFKCTNLRSVAEFTEKFLPQWEKFFFLEFPENLTSLRKGPRDVQMECREASGPHFRCRWRVNGTNLEWGDIRWLDEPRGWSQKCGWVRTSHRTQRAWRTLEKFGDPEKIPRYLLFSILNSEASLPVDEPLKEFLRQVRTFFAPPNKDKHPFLKSYQEYGVAWMRHLLIHGCHPLLADEMGLGKTLQVLALLRHFPSIGKPDLIVCPASVTGTWESQAAEFFPELKITPVENEISPTDEPVVFLGSYGQIRARAESQASFRFVILDEAQCIKNPDSQTALACLKLQSQYRLALTGTPIENRFLDLWTLFQFLMPGLLGSRKAFEARMTEPDATDRLRDQLGPFILRRTKEEVAAELPPKISTTVSCPMSESQKEHYEKILRGRDQLRTGEWRSLFTLLLRLRQASCDVGLLPGQASTDVQASSKTQWLKLKLEECVSQGRKVVIFSQFRRWLERLFPMVHDLYGGRSFTLFGDTMDRTERVNAFQTLDSPAAFLATLRTGYAGITLHAAHTVFLLDPWWNPSVEAQAVDRLHRIGQRKTVWIYRLLAKDSVEEKVQQLQQIKRGYFDAILGSTSQSEKGKWETLVRLLG